MNSQPPRSKLREPAAADLVESELEAASHYRPESAPEALPRPDDRPGARLPRIAALATAVPRHVVRQSDARAVAERLFAETLQTEGRLLDIFDHAQIDQRYACMPLEWYAEEHAFEERNTIYVENAVGLAAQAATRALERGGLRPVDIDHVVFVSTTGLATPSIDARLANELGLRGDIRRTPIWGLGCAGGAAGLSRAREFALADPEARILLVALELCSLSFQLGDLSKRNLVATSLFGDGAAAAIVIGAGLVAPSRNGDRPLGLVASQSTLWRDTEDVMGWTIDGAGLHVVFSRDIPTIVRERVRPGLHAFLERCGLGLDDVPHLVAHPGGVKVLNAYVEALGLPASRFEHARGVLRDYGNMSSPSCLFVLERFLDAHEIAVGDHAIVAALGPGFSAEYVLLRGVNE